MPTTTAPARNRRASAAPSWVSRHDDDDGDQQREHGGQDDDEDADHPGKDEREVTDPAPVALVDEISVAAQRSWFAHVSTPPGLASTVVHDRDSSRLASPADRLPRALLRTPHDGPDRQEPTEGEASPRSLLEGRRCSLQRWRGEYSVGRSSSRRAAQSWTSR
jgi:hypothetical protein